MLTIKAILVLNNKNTTSLNNYYYFNEVTFDECLNGLLDVVVVELQHEHDVTVAPPTHNLPD